jgi:hypothetical protein
VAPTEQHQKPDPKPVQVWRELASDLLAEFARDQPYFAMNQRSGGKHIHTRIDAVADFSSEAKKVQSELIYIEDSDELLKEAFYLLKSLVGNYQRTVLALVEEFDLNHRSGILHRLRLIKALLQTTKLGGTDFAIRKFETKATPEAVEPVENTAEKDD